MRAAQDARSAGAGTGTLVSRTGPGPPQPAINRHATAPQAVSPTATRRGARTRGRVHGRQPALLEVTRQAAADRHARRAASRRRRWLSRPTSVTTAAVTTHCCHVLIVAVAEAARRVVSDPTDSSHRRLVVGVCP
ncbi:hypothetical protein; putative signal peptide [Frankia alni ACN14a]|uniref:Uncharacterized protein n=1 Tax=Frankia alni (strain DSM 45986 / CECT 9034 / ACN14a) TaxID=326424 RepID=Q0RDM0_FRAAA|nr:hypothetical protein; putative signal peptide [Frankia alni ACN14a]